MLYACTKRYLLKLVILIITHYHPTLRMTDSIKPAGSPPITTLLALHFFLEFDKTYFCQQETQAAFADARPNHHPKLGASRFLSRRITRSCVPLMPAPVAAVAAPAAANLAPVNSCLEKSHAPALRGCPLRRLRPPLRRQSRPDRRSGGCGRCCA